VVLCYQGVMPKNLTVRLDDELEAETEALARAEGQSLNEVVKSALREAVERRRKDPNPPSFSVHVLTLEQAKERYAPLVRAGGSGQEAPAARELPRPEEVAFTLAEVSAMRTAFNALLRRAKAAQAAGLGGLAPAEIEAVGGTRAVLARFDAAGQS